MLTSRGYRVKVLSSPYLIAIVFTIPVCFFISRYFPAYYTKTTPSVLSEGVISQYFDIDLDGQSERISSYNDTKGHASYQVADQHGKLIYIQVYKGNFSYRGDRLTFGDYDSDGCPEIYCFYVRNDSLFLSSTRYSDEISDFSQDRYIAYLGRSFDVIDCDIIHLGMPDMDKDGKNELVFMVISGYSIFPRNVYIYDIEKDSLVSSEFLGGTSSRAVFFDIDQDGYEEIILNTYAPGNMTRPHFTGLVDTSAWLIVLDQQLNFKFPPYEFSGFTSSAKVSPFFRNGEVFIGAVVTRREIKYNHLELFVFNNRGELISRKNLPDSASWNKVSTIHSKYFENYFTVTDQSGTINLLDENLKINKTYRTGLKSNHGVFIALDIDQDDRRENIFIKNDGELIIRRENMSAPVRARLPLLTKFIHAGIKLNAGRNNELALQFGRSLFLVEYGRNPYYYAQFPLYLGIYIAFFLLIFLAQYLQRVMLREKYNAEKEISSLQLRMVKEQLDPHFIFNAINTINSLVILKRPEEAQQRIVDLSRLMKNVVESSGKVAQPLEDELNFIRRYLEFQRHRHEEVFIYSIDIEPEIDMTMKVPRMVMQIPVENAIKHGLLPRGVGGELGISLRSEPSAVLISIEDNGIGRAKAGARRSTGTGRGFSILDQNFEILNRYNHEKISYEVVDLLSEDGEAKGTRVNIRIPVHFNYMIYER